MDDSPQAVLNIISPAVYDAYHRTYICFIYLFVTFQFSLAWILCETFGSSWVSIQHYPESSVLPYIFMGWFWIILALLCIKPFNNINSQTLNGSMVLQFLFTLPLALWLSSAKWLWYWTFITPMLTLLIFSTSLISLSYYFTKFDFFTYQGMKILMFGKLILAGFLMSLYRNDIRDILDGYNLALMIMTYLVYGTNKLTNCEQIMFHMDNVLSGLSLIYTFFMIPVYYRNRID